MWTTDGIRDNSKRTGDLLNQIRFNLGLETTSPLEQTRFGDGANVVPTATRGLREGLQGTVLNTNRARKQKHPNKILITTVKRYYSKPTLTINKSSPTLQNLELYMTAYEKLKSKSKSKSKSTTTTTTTTKTTEVNQPSKFYPSNSKSTSNSTNKVISKTEITNLRDSVIN
jgi:hypothetical protein